MPKYEYCSSIHSFPISNNVQKWNMFLPEKQWLKSALFDLNDRSIQHLYNTALKDAIWKNHKTGLVNFRGKSGKSLNCRQKAKFKFKYSFDWIKWINVDSEKESIKITSIRKCIFRKYLARWGRLMTFYRRPLILCFILSRTNQKIIEKIKTNLCCANSSLFMIQFLRKDNWLWSRKGITQKVLRTMPLLLLFWRRWISGVLLLI